MTAARKWSGNEKLKPLLVPIADLSLDPKNARMHSPRNVKTIAASLSAHGQQTPLVISKEKVIAKGNGTLMAALELGWDHIAVLTYVPKDDKTLREYKLQDNRTAELAEWDLEILSGELRELEKLGSQMAEIGWEDYELEPLFEANFTPEDPKSLPPEQLGARGRSITVTETQREHIEKATLKYRDTLGDAGSAITEGAAVEAICKQWMQRK